MEHARPEDVTLLLGALEPGEDTRIEALLPLVYEELRTVAHRHRRRWQGDRTLGTTALVHEAYLKLVDQGRLRWEDRAHFMALASRAMRHILVNYSRDRRAAKRGGGRPELSLGALEHLVPGERAGSDDDTDLLLALDEALERLGRISERQLRIVECRFFGGMTIEETAQALGLSTATVSRGWALAQTRLYQDLHDGPAG